MDAVQLTAAATTIALYLCTQITESHQRLLIASVLAQVSESITRIDLEDDLLRRRTDINTMEQTAVDGSLL